MAVWKKNYLLYAFVFAVAIVFATLADRTVAVLSTNADNDSCVYIIDAGHGGEDGGASAKNGTLESQINLEIASRLNMLLQLNGCNTEMIRTTDTAVYTEGKTISEKKVSDLKNRVAKVNDTANALLISVHQNFYTDGRYSGAQVFYAPTVTSKDWAELTQQTLISAVDSKNRREAKAADGVYLMKHITCPGILVECGFLSNEREAAALETQAYQIKIAEAVAFASINYGSALEKERSV